MARRAAESSDDVTNDAIVSEVGRRNKLQVWFLAEHVIDMTRARAVMADGCFFDVTPYALIAVGGSPESFCVRTVSDTP
jgi:hypothetical protein